MAEPKRYNTGLTDTQLDEFFDNGLNKSPKHIADSDIHVTASEKEAWNKNTTAIATVIEQAVLNRQTLGTECKNLAKPKISTGTAVGVAYEVTADGHCTYSGTTTGSFTHDILATEIYAESDMIVSGANALSNLTYLVVYTPDGGTTQYKTIGTSGFTVPAKSTIKRLYVQQTASDKAVEADIYIMIRDARISDATYVPYKASVETRLTEAETEIQSSTAWNLIPTTYTTIADYAVSLPVGKHTAFYRNATDTHITDMPVSANMFVEIYKYSNSTMRIHAYPVLLSGTKFYSCCYSGGTWGEWFEFTGTAMTTTTEV